MAGMDIFPLGHHLQHHQDLEGPIPLPNKRGGCKDSSLHPMHMTMFLRGVHVTQAWPIRIFPEIVQTSVDTVESHNGNRQTHAHTETKMR